MLLALWTNSNPLTISKKGTKMSHPDSCYDPDNSHEDDMNYDDHDDFYGESMDYSDYNDDRDYDESMDGDHDSAMTSCGWGTDEDYGYYGDDDREDFDADEAIGFVDYNEDGPYDDY